MRPSDHSKFSSGKGFRLLYSIFVSQPARQVTSAYTIQPIVESDIAQQQQNFEALVRNLGQILPAEVNAILADRDQVESEPEL